MKTVDLKFAYIHIQNNNFSGQNKFFLNFDIVSKQEQRNLINWLHDCQKNDCLTYKEILLLLFFKTTDTYNGHIYTTI